MVRYQVTNWTFLTLDIKRSECDSVSLENTFKLENHLFAVRLRAPLVELGIVNVILVSATINLG